MFVRSPIQIARAA